MLILTRKKDETMVVGHDVTVKVLSVSGNQVKIGIEAPREVSIMRDELLDAKQDEASKNHLLEKDPGK
ncbi:MAG: carbon storage regulator [Zetaproteobacteria bacterium CG06_land_8_20_14_3_00_59_53]|nr:MAG: carbon storage regulator [Zetaproteobacteria bacterium CG2_30_59_37]PIO90050.1 MAG: carbon storage regulator [Zetaproteobacteria bacterium CG23_combo_of_CG06-09_8_20_14_all_59_86]PIQ64978.1 MAG: carbon storage regulator [Zetaproteobacteria bacterium CG11_big_fil_rev_8_21_14_0_20_59_439]PIU69452.1 MAG: carbon storage regulator [Zetaproteobacteria bacterium CG06_land_8_20_14_3_00_59_53]PIU96796.1 MAG: carbon storage regulator [Zetaproteobacteria bacterium CG03_land_8_20_14_0_80_59_51]PIY